MVVHWIWKEWDFALAISFKWVVGWFIRSEIVNQDDEHRDAGGSNIVNKHLNMSEKIRISRHWRLTPIPIISLSGKKGGCGGAEQL